MTKAIVDITPLTFWATSFGMDIRAAQRIALATSDMAAGKIGGLSLRWSEALARLGAEATWEPMRQLMDGEFHLFMQPKGDTRSIVHSLSPSTIVWYAATDSDTIDMPDYPIAGDLDNLLSHISGVGEDGFQHVVKMNPDISDIKRIRKAGIEGVVFDTPVKESGYEKTDDAMSYAARLGIEPRLLCPLDDTQFCSETEHSPDMVYIGGDIWFAALRNGISGIASMLSKCGL